VTTISAPRLTG